MKTRNLKKTVLALLIVPAFSWGQNSIHLQFVEENNSALSDVKVEVVNTFQKYISDFEGKVNFTISQNDSITIRCSVEGYISKVLKLVPSESTQQIGFTSTGKNIDDVVIVSTRATEKTPTTYSNIDKTTLAKRNFGQDLPFLLENTPSAVTTSDAGAGIGYTGLRIRGVDPTRTNVTINGIPINDAESHGVYWVNMPDMASSVESIQIQRGVGTSANGAAAFGASINIKTDNTNSSAFGGTENSIGSFGTMKNSVKFGTGLINGFSIDGRLSRIVSDGFLDRASSNLKSLMLNASWKGKKDLLKMNVFAGQERTYQSWFGTPESVVLGDKVKIQEHIDRNFYSLEEQQNLMNAGRSYNYYTYENQVDNYKQDHYQLHYSHIFSAKWKSTISAHYTKGKGFYEEFKKDQSFSNYGLSDVYTTNDTITSTDLVRRKWLDNDFYGAVYSLNYTSFKKLKLSFGGAVNQYDGKHFGEVIWAQFASNGNATTPYYSDKATKAEISQFIRGNYDWKKINVYVDLQFRHIDYSYTGSADVSGTIVQNKETAKFNFFNPKAGITFQVSKNSSIYTSFAIGNREPLRDDYLQTIAGKKPKAEQLKNLELGFRTNNNKWFTNANVYFMNYKNQLILTGQINDVGGYTRTNAEKSQRLGVELEVGYRILKSLEIGGNLTLSQNKVVEFTQFFDDYDNGGQVAVVHQNKDLAFSPNVVSAIVLRYEPIKNAELLWTTKIVGKQFLDNTSSVEKSLEAYNFSNVSFGYTIKQKLVNKLQISALVNNVFNQMYSSNGYTYSYQYAAAVTTENFLYPQAGRNFMLRLGIEF